MKRYNPTDIEPKWQAIWADDKRYTAKDGDAKRKYYVSGMFPYPSAAGMHIGHAFEHAIVDAVARFQRAQGANVLNPMGWDAFGLPAENYAIKTGTAPAVVTQQNIANFTNQLKRMGVSIDWSREIDTSSPEYYKWTQWIFTKLFERGLAYQKEANQWWCPVDLTVLANEQVENGKCWRCGSEVEKKSMTQWFFKITDYADALLDEIPALDWPDKIKTAQENWIGRSEGAEVEFTIHNSQFRSYIMGQKDITVADIESIGGRVVKTTEAGHLCVVFPRESAEKFEKLIVDKMQPGFWNEYIGDDVVFIFKHKDGKIERFILDEENEAQIRKLGNQFNDQEDDPNDRVEDWLVNNSWYAELFPNSITVFTTRPDTLFGATFLVLAPEHPLVSSLVNDDTRQVVEQYVTDALKKSEIERMAEGKDKTGVFSGSHAINPATGEQIPIWIADYVLGGYGTGAVMAVPAHDERDYEFAEKFELPVIQVVAPELAEQENPLREDMPLTERQVMIALVEHPTDDKFLTIKWNKFPWTNFVMGGIEDGESVHETALREIAEETGYTDLEFVAEMPIITNSKFYAPHKKVNRSIYSHIVHYRLKSLDQQEVQREAHEDFEVQWTNRADLEKLHPVPELEYILPWMQSQAIHYRGEGVLINSGVFDGMESSEAREEIVAWLEQQGMGRAKTTYKMRDWLVSRQRYWGAPIPIVHCETHGAVVVPEDQLPVLLPEVEDFAPKGESVLASQKDWVATTCPTCGGPARRETDTMDGYACSSWYLLRYTDPHNTQQAWGTDKADYWTPIDMYCGGDHAVAHLLYVRFWNHVFYDIGLVPSREPVKKLVYHGLIGAEDGRKMSKSLGNVVDPLDIIDQGYGADALRTFELFLGPINENSQWSSRGIAGVYRFLNRAWTLTQEFIEAGDVEDGEHAELTALRHRTVKKVTTDIHRLSFNTAIAALMEYVNELYKLKTEGFSGSWREPVETLVQLLSVFAPHLSAELWQQLGRGDQLDFEPWPTWDDTLTVAETMTIVVQVNGKVRAKLDVAKDAGEDDIKAQALAEEKVQKFLDNKQPTKVIYVPGRLVNVVV